MRHQPPVWSPLTLRAIGAGVFPSSRALAELSARVGAEYGSQGVLLTSSGTVALSLAFLAAAGKASRPRVALPGWACYDLMTAADAVDAEVLFYDLDPSTLAPDEASLARALDRRPHAVVVAHWFGLPTDLRDFARQVESAGALLIDDAAQGVGASVAGRPAGSGGSYGILSFGRGKGRTGGGGGALLLNSESAGSRATDLQGRLELSSGGTRRLLALAGQWAFGRPSLYWLPARLPGLRLGETIYHEPAPPRRMSTQSAAIASAVWLISAQEAKIRRSNAVRWERLLEGATGVHTYRVRSEATGGWLRYPILTSDPISRALGAPSMRRRGVMPGYPGVLGDLNVVRNRILEEKTELPGARHLADHLFTLPTHRHVRSTDVEKTCEYVHLGRAETST
jgi:perosamine synthetase